MTFPPPAPPPSSSPPPPPPPPPSPRTPTPARWRDQRGLALALIGSFGVMLVSSALLAIALANRISVVRDVRSGNYTDILRRAQDADDYVSAASSLFVLIQVVIVVLFIVWIFRAAKNNEALGRANPRFGPGWAIGSWFIPIANLVIPVLIVQDLWRGGDASRVRGDAHWRTAPGSSLVGWWWAAWLISLVRFTYAGVGLHDSGSLDDIETSNTVALVGVVVLAVAAVLAILVVRAVSRRQLETLRVQRAAYEAAPAG